MENSTVLADVVWEEILLGKYRILILKGNCFYWQILI
jgi:hypothetical protein